MNVADDNVQYLREWAKDIRGSSGVSVDADRLDAIANELQELRGKLLLGPSAPCERCKGTGWLEGIEGRDGSYVTSRPCPNCSGIHD